MLKNEERIEAAAKAAYHFYIREEYGNTDLMTWEMLHPDAANLWRTLVQKAQRAYEDVPD